MPRKRAPNLSKAPTIVVAVTGAVGAVTVPHLLTALRRRLRCETRLVLTRAAQRFLTGDAARAFSGTAPILEGQLQSTDDIVPHLSLTANVDLLLVYPATANIIGKVACGIADDVVSTTILAAQCPTLFVPGMNEVMWSNPIVRSNVDRLQQHGYQFVPPGQGIEVATMEVSSTAMPPLPDVVERIRDIISQRHP
jgi:phosphopantothenoylcysteine synthetase/decarboxylase